MTITVNEVEKFAKAYRGYNLFGVPRGGTLLVEMMARFENSIIPVYSPDQADVIIDDIIDSGKTLDDYSKYEKPFVALIDKRKGIDEWVTFEWEAEMNQDAEDIPRRLLQYLGEDCSRGGLIETPKRFLKAWKFYTKGYDERPEDILKVFEDGAENSNEMIIVKEIPFYSNCEHHLATIFGSVSIGYIPNGKIVGLSKLSRLVDIFARRLQVQERMTNQIIDALNDCLNPSGCGIIVRARHMCMESRGIQQVGSITETIALRGSIKADKTLRSEFISGSK